MQDLHFTDWIKFSELYSYDPEASSREGKFKHVSNIVTTKVAGIYLVADSKVSSLNNAGSVIYIGKTSGKDDWSTFHERLWKHCSKAIGECGGKFSYVNGMYVKDKIDTTEPKDTGKWADYRNNKFHDFNSWHFSFLTLENNDFESAKREIALIEDLIMYAYSYYSNPKLALCNSQKPSKSVKFPWLQC
jgi:hypothetical protein